MSTLHATSAKAHAIIAETLLTLERRGQYREALAEVEHIWKDIRELPDVDGFAPRDAAEILLRCGSLIGFHGQNEQISESQIISKNLLTNAHQRFWELRDTEKVAECENNLAVVYSRTGEYNEAEAYLASSFAQNIPPFSDARLHSHVITSLINLSCNRHKENLEYQKLYDSDFKKHASDYLKGMLSTNIGVSHKNLGNINEALTYQELAKYHYQRARNKIYFGIVENNLANLYKETRKFSKAHSSIDSATRLFKQLKDKNREGFSLDTKASIYFAESKYDEALRTVNRALATLRKSENSAFLIDTLLSKAKILLYLDNFPEAVLNLSEAVEIARVQTGDKAAIHLIQQFEAALDAKNTPTKKNIESDDFELVLPKKIARFKNYSGIWITNDGLETIGLAKGALAVVAKTKVKPGDLAAMTEVESGEVICGFYDADIGIVCIEDAHGEPQIFDQSEVSMLGKIVGVCKSGRNDEGKMVVEALNI